VDLYERLSTETAADYSKAALDQAISALDEACAAHGVKAGIRQTCQDRVDLLQKDILPRLQADALNVARDSKASKAATRHGYLFDGVPLPDAADQYQQAAKAAPLVNEALLYVGTTLLPEAELSRLEADVDLLYAYAHAVEAEARTRMIRRIQAAQELIELEGGSLELVTGTGVTAEVVRRAVEAYAAADAAQAHLEQVQKQHAQKQLEFQ
jgi:hypothetical protein